MSDSKITERQKQAWLLTAMLAPLAHVSGVGWAGAAVGAAAILPVLCLPGDFSKTGRAEAVLQWLAVELTAAVLLPAAGSCWPGEKSELAVPTVLLLLAAMTGTVNRAANVSGLLRWAVGILAVLIGYLGMKEVRTVWLRPGPVSVRPELFLVLLLPRLGNGWGREQKKKPLLTIGIAAVAAALLVQGNLSLQAAARQEAPFYQMARSLRLGSLTRLEPLVSVTMTFSWFCMALWLVMAAAAFAHRAGVSQRTAVWASAAGAGAMMMLDLQEEMHILLIADAILWIVAPLIHFEKKSKKDEKRC